MPGGFRFTDRAAVYQLERAIRAGVERARADRAARARQSGQKRCPAPVTGDELARVRVALDLREGTHRGP
jgi:hypothetical protein